MSAPSVDYVLAEMRCAVLRAKLWQADLEAIGIALRGGLVSPEQALELLHDCGILEIVGLREVAA
jgi:hypothetical protein